MIEDFQFFKYKEIKYNNIIKIITIIKIANQNIYALIVDKIIL